MLIFSDLKLPLLKIYTLGLVLVGILFLNFTVDDAFISFRYGKNLVEHGVWNWNPSNSDLVEAYTNPIFAALSIFPHWFGFNVILPFKLLGVILLAANYYVLSKDLSVGGKWACAAFMATNMFIFPHAFSGLETLAFFLSAFWLMTLDGGRIRNSGACLMILLAPLLRPEGALLSLYIVYRQVVGKTISMLTIVAVISGVIYFGVRYNYFGWMLPNTFYAKSGDGLATFMRNALSERYVIYGWIISMIYIIRHQGKIVLPSLLFMGYVFGNLTAELQMNYAHRFAWHMLMPAVFYAFWLAMRQSEADSCETRKPGNPETRKPGNQKWTMPAVLFVVAAMMNWEPQLWDLLVYYPNAVKSHRALGNVLAKYQDKRLILAVGDAGLIPYYSGLHTIDYIGLANTEVAHAIREKRKALLDRPDVVALFSNNETSCAPRAHQYKGEESLRLMLDTEQYACVNGPKWGNVYYVNLLVKKNMPGFDRFVLDVAEVKRRSNGRKKVDELKDVLLFKGLQ